MLNKKLLTAIPALFSIMMVPSFAKGLPAPPPLPSAAENAPAGDVPPPSETGRPPSEADSPAPFQSNAGAVNEGGGSANTNGMNNGTMPNSSGSGSNAALATDYLGIPFGGSGKPTSGEVDQKNETSGD